MATEKGKTASSALNNSVDNEKLATLSRRVDELRSRNEEQKSKIEKGERDTHDFVEYFQREMEKRDETISSLNETLTRKEEEFQKKFHETNTDYEQKITSLQEELSLTDNNLRSKLKSVEAELMNLEEFKGMKKDLERDLAQLKADLADSKRAHQEHIDQKERKFLEEKARMQKEYDRKVEEIKKVSREEAQSGLDSDTRKIVTDNRRMGEELRFQLSTTGELQKEKKQMEDQIRSLLTKVALYNDSEQEYAKQGHRQTKEIHSLRTKVKDLERTMNQMVYEFEIEKEKIEKGYKKDLEEATLDAAGLRQLVKLKNKELHRIKSLAQTVLNQRTEVEQYFLEALEQVKLEIVRQKKEEHNRAVMEYKSQMRSATLSTNGSGRGRGKEVKFPTIRTVSQMYPAHTSPSRLPMAPSQKVDLKDLSWEDRERVLRLLFAKINNIQGFVDSGGTQDSASGGGDSADIGVHGNGIEESLYSKTGPDDGYSKVKHSLSVEPPPPKSYGSQIPKASSMSPDIDITGTRMLGSAPEME